MKVYSFKDLSGAFSDPLAGDFQFAGQIGMGQITVTMATERTSHDTAADGTVMPSYIAGDSGTISIEIQQTSELQSFLLAWFNGAKTLADQGDLSGWASAKLTLRSLQDGTQHLCRGLSPLKIPDHPYAAQGQKLTWMLMCADIQNTTA